MAAPGLPEEESAELQSSLRVGDSILLYAKEVNGYVFSELSSSKHNSVAVGRSLLKDPNLPNVHFATFKVVPANKFKAQERLLDIKKQLKGRELTTATQSALLQAQKDLDSELKDNDAEQDRLQGSSLVYGETIQLLHTLSKRYLCVSTTYTSRTENTNLRVELQSENNAGCIFKILPRYKVRSVGDEIRYNDQVKFESIKTEGQFLHCSVKLYKSIGFNVHGNCHEVNLSATESALTVIPHHRPTPGQDPKTFRGGSTVRLFHREYECYIVAEGSFAEDPAVIEDAHCRKRHSDHGILKDPSTSSNTYWQFERESDSRSGEPIFWTERVRIKHLPTRCYLAVSPHNGGYTVTLKESTQGPRDLDTVFSLYPVIQEGDMIQVESYARIKHLQTRTWLHLKKSQPYVRRGFDPTAPGLAGLEWDSAELFTLTATEAMNYDDAFTLELVEEQLLNKFNYVAGIVPILTNHIREREQPGATPLDSRRSYPVASALQELAESMVTTNDRDSKDKQKLLRNLRVLELVIKILGFFKLDTEDTSQQRGICKACYLVIENYLKGDSRKNENYLARFIDFFRTQVRMGLNAEQVMIEMCEDNLAIVSKVAESQLDNMIQLLVETKDPRFMEVLGNLCVCANRPIPATQNAILEKLVYTHGEDVFYRTEVGGSDRYPRGEKGVVYFRKPGTGDDAWEPITKIAARDIADGNDDCEFLESQLQLLGKLCKGNNAHTIDALDKDGLAYVTFEEALICASDEDLHPNLRSMYVELITVMFVDVGENRAVLENLSYSFIYDECIEDPYAETGGDDITALTGVANQYFPEMRDWIKEHISGTSKRRLIASEVEDNQLLAKVLEVLSLLVKYGYYDDPDDVDDVLRPLTSVLDGMSDIPFPDVSADNPLAKHFLAEGRFKETAENEAIFEIKDKGMEVVDLFFNFRFYVRLQRFIYDFRLLKGDVEPEEPGSPTGGFRLGLGGSGSTATGIRPPTELEELQRAGVEILRNPLVVTLARDRLKFIYSKSAYFFESADYSGTPFHQILLDLSRYECDQLVQSSLHLLNRYYSSELSLFKKGIQTQLLVTEESKKVFNEVGELVPTLRRYMSIDVGEKERATIIKILQTFSAMCTLQGDESEAHQQNQKILYNYGILSDVLNYVLQHAKQAVSALSATTPSADEPRRKLSAALMRKKTVRGGTGGDPSSIQQVFVECFKFLKALAVKNIEVQQRLYDRMNDLLETEVAVPFMAEVLTEAFTGGPVICLKVREEEVERVFHLISQGGAERVEGRAELILTLQAMAKVEELDLPVKRNQAFIIKYFSKTREKFCDHVLGEGLADERWKLLHEALDEDFDLQLLLTMTDLLASCSEGENLFIESVCQTVFTVKELLRILSCPFLPPDRKRPFARFLVWVYMNTEGDTIQTGASELSKSSDMWNFLEYVSTLLHGMNQVLRTVNTSDNKLLREGLSSRSRTTSMSFRGKEKPVSARTQSKAVPHVTGEDGGLLPGLLLFFSDGVMPLLKVYFKEFFEPPMVDAAREKQMEITTGILNELLRLSDVLVQHFSLDSQVKLFRATVVTILQGGPTQVQFQLDEEAVTNFDKKTEACMGVLSEAKVEYSTLYASEVQLNDVFNKFVTNFQLVYQGPNTARAQIGARFSTTYSDFLDEDLSKPGDEYLPLGPSFQEHVSCFCNHFSSASHVVKPIAARLLKQLEISFDKLEDLDEVERTKQDEVDLKCLQILRAIIHNEIMFIDPDLKENNATGFRKRCVSRLHPIQNTIQGFDNAVARVAPLLSHPNDAIVCEVLAFLKALFYSGNRNVQQGMEHLLTTREERLFSTLQSLLYTAAITYKERRSLLAQVEARIAADKLLLEDFAAQRHAKTQPDPEDSAQRKKVTWKKDKKEVGITIEVAGEDGEAIPLDSLGPRTATGTLLAASREERDTSSLLLPPGASPSHSASPGASPGKGKAKRQRASSRSLIDAGDLFKGAASAVLARRRASEHGGTEYDPYAGIDAKTADILRFQDSQHIKLALQVLGLMCDGQYRLMQNYLREQKDNIHTINIVGDVAIFIQHFYNDINAETMELVHLILQTLIEMCVGNYPNQAVIFNRQIIDAINRILQLDIADHERSGYTIQDSVNLKASAVELLEAMMEETNEKTRELVSEIVGGVDLVAVHETLADFYELMNDPDVIAESFDDEAERGLFRTYHVLVHFGDYPDITMKKVEPDESESEEVRRAWAFCKRRSKSIEVKYTNMDGDKILTKVHFQFDPVNELREEVIENVKWNVNRDSPEDKLRDFLEWMFAVKRDTIHHNKLHRNWFTKILISFPQIRYWLLVFLSIVLNILLLITFSVPQSRIDRATSADPGYSKEDTLGAIEPDVKDWFGDYLLYNLGSFHLILTIWMVLEYFIVNLPNFVLPRFIYKPLSYCGVKTPETTYSDINVLGLRTAYIIIFILCSIFSLPFYGYFYPFCLLHIVVNNDILQRVLRSVTKNGIALLWVAALGVVILYIYAVVSFAFLHESFLQPDNNDATLFCRDLGECFVSTIRYGLLDNLGLVVPFVPEGSFTVNGVRLLYDVTFFIIVTTIGLNIVFGIIVDTFSELRDERFRTEQDKKAFCFICSFPNHEFERRSQGFDHHVKHDHNMWAYIYYSIYLDGIDISDHNAIEQYVYGEIRDGKFDFFPLLSALCLETEADETAAQLSELKTMVRNVLDRFKEEEHEKTLRVKRQEQQKWEERNLRKDTSSETASLFPGRSFSLRTTSVDDHDDDLPHDD